MDFSRIFASLKTFDTAQAWQLMQEMNISELIHNPWFLGTIGVLAVVALLMRWRVLLTLIVSITAFTWLLSYVQQRGTDLEGGLANETLLIFAGGGTFIVFLAIYLLFVKGD
jgi:hypothetical protein